MPSPAPAARTEPWKTEKILREAVSCTDTLITLLSRVRQGRVRAAYGDRCGAREPIDGVQDRRQVQAQGGHDLVVVASFGGPGTAGIDPVDLAEGHEEGQGLG